MRTIYDDDGTSSLEGTSNHRAAAAANLADKNPAATTATCSSSSNFDF